MNLTMLLTGMLLYMAHVSIDISLYDIDLGNISEVDIFTM